MTTPSELAEVLASLGDVAFMDAWRAMPADERNRLPSIARTECVDRFRRLTPEVGGTVERPARSRRRNGNGEAPPAPPPASSATAVIQAEASVGEPRQPPPGGAIEWPDSVHTTDEAAAVLCSRYQYIAAVGAFWDIGARIFVKPGVLTDANAHWMPFIPVQINGETRRVRAKAAKLATEHTRGNKFDLIGYRPGLAESFTEGAARIFNTYRPSGVVRAAGDASTFADHIHYLAGDNESWAMAITRWLAYLVQHPGRKIAHGLLLVNEREGTGRNWLFGVIASVLGRHNVYFADEDRISTRFNAWALSTQLLIISELEVGDGRRTHALRLKPLLAGDPIAIEAKGKDPAQITNIINVIAASNRIDATIVSRFDRRWFIVESTLEPKPTDYYDRMYAWAARPETPGAVLDYLLSIDLSAFNPSARPEHTPASEEAALASLPMAAQAILSAIEEERGPFRRPLVIVSEIADWLALRRLPALSEHSIGRILKSAGAVKLGQKRIRCGKVRVWALRDIDRWRRATEQAIADEFRPLDAE